MELTQEIKEKFLDLACQLSPESLTCDGELSKTESNRRYRECMRQWRLLEKQIGRTVDEGEAWEWEYAKGKKNCFFL